MIRAIGVDPSLTATGLCLPDGTCVTVKPTHKADKIDARLHEIFSRVSAIFWKLSKANAVDLVVIEAVLPGHGKQLLARIRLAQLAGVIRLAAYEACIDLVEVNPVSLKRYIAGNARADKSAMIEAARNTGIVVRNDNEADAWGLRTIGEDFYNKDTEELDAYQRAFFAKLKWPEK